MIAVKRMALREPVPNAALNLAKKVEIALDSQMSKIANQIGDGMFVTRAAAMLKNGKRVGGRGNVFGFFEHHPPNLEIGFVTGVLFNFFGENAEVATQNRKGQDASCVLLVAAS